MLVSVIIPTLNEEGRIASAIASVIAQSNPREVIVSDGGSRDRTASIAADHALVLSAPRGRARQMNTGAARSRGEALVFLHADTHLPEGALDAVRNALDDPEVVGGAFRLSFDRRHPLLSIYAFFTRIPSRRICFGDRALFFRRSAFEAVGGFPEIPIFEDLEMARLVSQRGRFRYLPLAVRTAARRFERHGIVSQQLRNAYLWANYVGGRDPQRLARLYGYE